MKVSRAWLKELVDLKVSEQELIDIVPFRTIGTKEITDQFIELDMKGYNRADLLSMRGVAYEVGAITDSEVNFKEPEASDYIWVEKSLPNVDVQVEDDQLVPHYCIAKIEGLKVRKSNPEWIKKLEESGVRAVNNAADVTNLVMLEYGQPLHAFDASEVKDQKIIVRLAQKDEEIVTLDNKTRQLEEGDLLITDPKKALGLAGVMGGKNSEVTEVTRTILLEAAIFDPGSLRKTATRLNLASEASRRFYHGLTKKRLFQALDAAIRMYQKLGGKLTALTITGKNNDQLKKVPLSLKKVNDLIGVEISKEEVEDYLKKLNFELLKEKNSEGAPAWIITPPYYRLDINIEEDLIEEVARMYGYEKIPSKELVGKRPEPIDQSLFKLIRSLKDYLSQNCLTEVQTYSYFPVRVLENYGWYKNNNTKFLVKVSNPISAETEFLRQNIWSNLLNVAAENLKYFDDVAIFEIGKIYFPKENSVPEEKYNLAVLIVGKNDNPIAEVNQIFKKVINDVEIEATKPMGIASELFHPTRFAAVKYKGEQIGSLAEVHPRLANKFGIEKRVAVVEVFLEKLLSS